MFKLNFGCAQVDVRAILKKVFSIPPIYDIFKKFTKYYHILGGIMS